MLDFLLTTKKTTVISSELKELIDRAASTVIDFGSLWGQIKQRGIAEGHSEEDLKTIVLSSIKQALPDNLTKEQIKKKVWYLFHSEEHKARSKANTGTGTSTGGTNLRTNDDKKDIEESNTKSELEKNNETLKETIANQEDAAKAKEEYYKQALDNHQDTIAELRSKLEQRPTVQESKSNDIAQPSIEEPDDYVKNLEAELAEVKKLKRDFVVGSWCPPSSNAYNHPKNHWKELVIAMRHIGYDIQPLYENGRPVASKARGFNIGIADGEFDGFFGIK